MEKEGNIINKSIFAVGLIAIILSLYQFNGEFSHIIIQDNGSQPVSLLSVIIFFCFLLIISVYLYALNYIKYSFKQKIQTWFVFKIIIFFADLFYFLALFFPLLVIFVSVLNKFNISYEDIIIFDTIAALVLIITGVISTVASYKK
jgi:hypothetical protein